MRLSATRLLGFATIGMIAATALVPAAQAEGTPGVVIVRSDRTLGPRPGTSTTTIKLTKQAARIDSEGTSLIYRRDLNTAWMIQGDSYMVLDKDAANRMQRNMAAQSNKAKAQMDQALAAVPADKRAMVEQMMKEQGVGQGGIPGAGAPAMPAQEPQPTFTKGASGTVGAWSCDLYDGKVGGVLKQRVCATGIENLGLSDEDVEIMLYAAEYFWALSNEMGGQAAAPPADLLGMEEEQGFPGYALSRTRFQNGEPAEESTVTKAERTQFGAAEFAKPALKERKFGVPPS